MGDRFSGGSPRSFLLAASTMFVTISCGLILILSTKKKQFYHMMSHLGVR